MIVASAFGALAGAMIAFPREAAEAALAGLRLWAGSVVPVLGPFIACMLMLTSRVGGGIWLKTGWSWLCGSPGGARLMQDAGLKGSDALRSAAMTGTMSPMFFLGTVSAWLGCAAAARLILACHIFSAFLIGACFPKRMEGKPPPPSPLPLGAAVRESALALLTVGVCMMLGCIAARMAGCAFPRLPSWAAAGMQCALEVTAGVRALIALNTPYTAPLICAACSFGGLSILLQNAVFWQESGVTALQLLGLRLAHSVLSGCLCQIARRALFSLGIGI